MGDLSGGGHQGWEKIFWGSSEEIGLVNTRSWGGESSIYPAISSMQKKKKKIQRKDLRTRGDKNWDVPLSNWAGKEHGCFSRLGILGNSLLTFTNAISLIEVPTRAELTFLLLIINNSSTVKCVLMYSVSLGASPRALQRRNCTHV